MDNYEAIMKMDREHLAAFLDDVYVTGLNNGMYAAAQSEEAQDQILDEFPYGEEWLAATAEDATLYKRADDGDVYLLNASVAATLRVAGITAVKEEN